MIRNKEYWIARALQRENEAFAAPDLLVLPGDSISLKRFGREDPNSRRLLAFQVVGRPAVYATHQEIKVKDGDLA